MIRLFYTFILAMTLPISVMAQQIGTVDKKEIIKTLKTWQQHIQDGDTKKLKSILYKKIKLASSLIEKKNRYDPTRVKRSIFLRNISLDQVWDKENILLHSLSYQLDRSYEQDVRVTVFGASSFTQNAAAIQEVLLKKVKNTYKISGFTYVLD